MALANYAATQVKITYKKIRGKEPLVTGNVRSVIDSLRDQPDEQSSQVEEQEQEQEGDLRLEFS